MSVGPTDIVEDVRYALPRDGRIAEIGSCQANGKIVTFNSSSRIFHLVGFHEERPPGLCAKIPSISLRSGTW